MMLAKDKQKERAKVPMCVTDWVMLKLETGGGGGILGKPTRKLFSNWEGCSSERGSVSTH